MDKDQIKGKMNDAAGRAKRQVGEWTGDTEAQTEGAAQQVKGKVQEAWGKVKDAARDTENKVKRDNARAEEVDEEQPRKDRDVA